MLITALVLTLLNLQDLVKVVGHCVIHDLFSQRGVYLIAK